MLREGLGVLLKKLTGYEAAVRDTIVPFLGRKIESAIVSESGLVLSFEGGDKLALFDDGQSCCEYRYMTCDDDLTKVVGDFLVDVELTDWRDVDDQDCSDVHEMAFLRVHTSGGVIVCETHNKHNGYYGGFCLGAATDKT